MAYAFVQLARLLLSTVWVVNCDPLTIVELFGDGISTFCSDVDGIFYSIPGIDNYEFAFGFSICVL